MSEPRCKDITKTYPYRAVDQFVSKSKEIGLDERQMQALVKEIVKYAKEKKLLSRGTALLNMVEVFKICCDRLELSIEATNDLVENIKVSARLLDGKPLHVSENIGGYSKILCLINGKQIPIELLAISKRCSKALQMIEQDERSMLPSNEKLLQLRIKLLIDADHRAKLRAILCDDLLETGVPK